MWACPLENLQGLAEKEQYFEGQAKAGRSINHEFDNLPAGKQLEIIEDIRVKRTSNPSFLPDLAISGGSGEHSNGWHLRAIRNTSEQSNLSEMTGTEKSVNKEDLECRLTEAARWHVSQHGDDAQNPHRWYGCSATSLHMALLHHGIQGVQQSEEQRKQLIASLHVSTHDGFHGGTQAMAQYARAHGLKAEAHLNSGAPNDIKALDLALCQGKGAITNGGVPRPDGSTLKHFVYVSSKVGADYVVGDPENDKPVIWTRDQMLRFLQRGSHGFVAVCR